MEKTRCAWCTKEILYQNYHDFEWGIPVHDDIRHFEMLILEAMQAGLSWYTVLKKRENFRSAFDNFNPLFVAQYDEKKIAELLQNPLIIRNRLKIHAAVTNARHFLEIQNEYGSFDAFIWNFVQGTPIIHNWETHDSLPAKTPLSDSISIALKKRGFTFVGSTIIYAYMQAVGLVNDHTIGCFCM